MSNRNRQLTVNRNVSVYLCVYVCNKFHIIPFLVINTNKNESGKDTHSEKKELKEK